MNEETLLQHPLPVEMTVVLSTVFFTLEPAMKKALQSPLILTDFVGTLPMKLGRDAA
jgi:hypothetical protein